MSLRLVKLNIEIKDGLQTLPRKCNIYDFEFIDSQLQLFVTMDDKEGWDEFDFKFIRPNQFIYFEINEYAYLGKAKDKQDDILIFFKILKQHI